ncbi:zf-HC2 domain-containing protein [Desulforamulus aeronauticus]|uniref:Anti-sigma-W factor RsiW n=1 Tax=Desulforamulus aeronauticus DSM 10349 TaxID=1121421 RepID=A0A1M6RLN6_9FIRM|nr:zf-HC2 domain-containing protein [Desulforamulus aeronauticus]SHK33267.1 protein of unknown function [Desulforamulus aeronauticus DSM 10349]
MQCQAVLEMLSPYLDGVLDPAEYTAVEEHLAHCSSCRFELEELRSCMNLLQELPELSPPAGFRAGLMEKIDRLPSPTEVPVQKSWFDRVTQVSRHSWYRTAAVAAVMVMALGVTSLWEKDGNQFIPVPNQTPDVASIVQPNPDKQETEVKDSEPSETPVTVPDDKSPAKAEPNKPAAKPDEKPVKSTGQPARSFTVENYQPQPSEGLVDRSVLLKVGVQDPTAALRAVSSITQASGGSIVAPYSEASGKVVLRVPLDKSRGAEGQLKALGTVVTDMPTDKDLSGQHKQAVTVLDRLKEQKDQLEKKLVENAEPEVETQLATVNASIDQQIQVIQQLENLGKYAEIAIILE